MIYNTPGPVDWDCGTLAYQELGTTIVPLGCDLAYQPTSFSGGTKHMAWPQAPLSWLFNESIACDTKYLVWPTNNLS